MEIGDRVRENTKPVAGEVKVLEDTTLPSGLFLAKGAVLNPDGWIIGTIESVGIENDWHVDWDDGRRTDQNEVHQQEGKRKGQPCLVKV